MPWSNVVSTDYSHVDVEEPYHCWLDYLRSFVGFVSFYALRYQQKRVVHYQARLGWGCHH